MGAVAITCLLSEDVNALPLVWNDKEQSPIRAWSKGVGLCEKIAEKLEVFAKDREGLIEGYVWSKLGEMNFRSRSRRYIPNLFSLRFYQLIHLEIQISCLICLYLHCNRLNLIETVAGVSQDENIPFK